MVLFKVDCCAQLCFHEVWLHNKPCPLQVCKLRTAAKLRARARSWQVANGIPGKETWKWLWQMEALANAGEQVRNLARAWKHTSMSDSTLHYKSHTFCT